MLNQLWRFTAMQSSFGANMIALNGGRPEMMTLHDMLTAFLEFREEVVTRRTKFLLGKARDSAHIQVGLAIAVANIDEVIRLIRTSSDSGAARAALMERVWPARDMAPLIGLIADPRHTIAEDGTIRLSDAQARAILELRLARLTALGRDEIAEALNKLAAEIADYLEILGSRVRLMGIIRDELIAVKTAFADKRRTEILEVRSRHGRRGPDPARGHGRARQPRRLHQARAALDLSRATARRQGPVGHGDARGGFRRAAVRRLDASAGAVFFLEGPGLQGEGLAPAARGAAGARQGARQHAAARAGERITTIMPLPEDEATWEALDVMFATTRGTVRRNKLSDFAQVNRAGKIAMKLDEGEGIVDVQICSEKDDVLLTTALGQCIRFAVDDVRVFKGRDSWACAASASRRATA